MSPEGAGFESPGPRPGTTAEPNPMRALKGRDSASGAVTPFQGWGLWVSVGPRGVAPGSRIPPLQGVPNRLQERRMA
jgi:hypothetical protein